MNSTKNRQHYSTYYTTINEILDDEGIFQGFFPSYLRSWLEEGLDDIIEVALYNGIPLNRDIVNNCLMVLAKRHHNLAIRSLITHFQFVNECSGITYDTYAKEISAKSAQEILMNHVPLLGSLAKKCQSNWKNYLSEVFRAICEDENQLRNDCAVAGKLTNIELGLGDSHRSGKSIAICTWTCGRKLVLKFTAGTPAGFVSSFVQKVDPKGDFFGPLIPQSCPSKAGNREWQKFVYQSTFDEDSAQKYFRVFGRCAALILALGGNDFHRENVIATQEGPIFVDTETFTSLPAASVLDPNNLFESVAWSETNSVLRTLLFPTQFVGSPIAEELSAIGLPVQEAKVSFGISIVEKGTDRIRFDETSKAIEPTANTVLDDEGKQFDPRRFLPEIVEGFCSAFNLLKLNRDLLEDTLTDWKFGIRHVPRPTWLYARLLEVSTHPSRLEHQQKRNKTLELLGSVDPQRLGQSLSQKIRLDEIYSLNHLDIPYFWIDQDGEVFGHDASLPLGRIETTPAACMKYWWKRVLNSDIDEQVRRLNLSMSAAGSNPYAKSETSFKTESLLEPAGLPIGVSVGSGKERKETWLTTQQIQGKVQLNLVPSSFYEGGGVLVSYFLDQRHAESQESKEDRLRSILNGCMRHEIPEYSDEVPDLSYSAFGGIVGESLTELELFSAGIHHDFKYIDAFGRIIQDLDYLLRRFQNSESQDYLNGLSGTFMVLNQFRNELAPCLDGNDLSRFDETQIIKSLQQSILTLEETIKEGDALKSMGIAHGLSGKLLGLSELTDFLAWGGIQLPVAIYAKLGLLVSEVAVNTSHDLAFIDGVAAHSWCKGRAGWLLAMSRLSKLTSKWNEVFGNQYLETDQFDDLLNVSASLLSRTISQFCETSDVSFCHGAGGALLTWTVLAENSKNTVAAELSDQYFANFNHISTKKGWRSGLQSAPSAEGFFVGRSGWDLATAIYRKRSLTVPRSLSLVGKLRYYGD